MLFRSARFNRVAASAVAILVAISVFAFAPGKAAASACRTDPVVVLTNGAQLQFGAYISTTYSNVQSVVYTVHAPVNSAMLLVVYTDNPLGSVETVHFHADNPTNQYSVDTVVYTRSGSAQVNSSALLVNLLHITLAHGSASGANLQHLYIPLDR